MQQALREAQAAFDQDEVPIGAVIVHDDALTGNRRVIGVAHNQREQLRDPTAHAETNLVADAIRRLSPEEIRRSVLYTSCEPCAMCAGKLYWAGIRSVVYALSSEQLATMAGGNFLIPCNELFARAAEKVTVTGPMLLNEARQVHIGYWPPPMEAS